MTQPEISQRSRIIFSSHLQHPIVGLDPTHVLLGLLLSVGVVVNVVTDGLSLVEVHLAGLLHIESLGGDAYQPEINTKKQENGF